MERHREDTASQDTQETTDTTTDTENTDVPEAKKPTKQKSLFDMAKEVEEKERIREAELERQANAQHERDREDYAKQLQQDRIELIKLKQGAIDYSETIHEVHEEAPVLTFPQKVSNFFYHNAWWLWVVLLLALVVSYITYDVVTTPKPDATVLVLVTDYELGETCSEKVSEYFEQFIEDQNGDGVSTVNVYYIPINTSETDQLYTSYMVKYSGEMQSANSMLVIADEECKDRLLPNETLYDLSQDFEDCPNVQKYRYYLDGTSFAEAIGYEGTLGSDVYLGVRKVQKVFDSEEEMQENFDVAMELVTNLISYENGDANVD